MTTETGAYQFPSVPIGTYSVTFELSGFKKAVAERTSSSPPGSTPAIDQKLEVGQMTEEVTVSARPRSST